MKKQYCGECKHFLNEDIYGNGYCETFNEGRICGQLCKNLENEHKISNDMKNKILDLVKSTVWLILCLIVFSLAFEGIYSLVNRNEPAKEFGTTVFSKRGHDYLLIDTRHGVCVIHAKSYPCNNKKIPKQ